LLSKNLALFHNLRKRLDELLKLKDESFDFVHLSIQTLTMTSFRNLQQPTGRIITLEEKDYLFFGGTAYLGLLANPEYIELYKKGIDRYGLNNGTSRTNNVQLGIYQEAEDYLAARFGFESTLLFSSGYLAAQTAVKSLSKGKKIFYAPNTHPALWLDENPEVIDNFDDWAAQTVEEINTSESSEFVIISNSIDNLTPRRYDFSVFRGLSSSKHVTMILDDSHGIGILKKNQVSVDFHPMDNIDLVVVASLAKGMGTDAGLVLGRRDVTDKIKKNPIYTGASPSAGASLYALMEGEKLYAEAFDSMQANTTLMSKLVIRGNLNSIPDFPVFSSKHAGLYRFLLQKQILISSFPYPLPSSPLLNRIVLSALHSEDDIRHIGEIMSSEIY